MSNPKSPRLVLSQLDLDEHIHRLSLPSPAALPVAPRIPQGTPTKQRKSRNRNTSNATTRSSLSNSSAERDRERRLQRRRLTNQRSQPASALLNSPPPPRRSSKKKKKSEFVGFDGIFKRNNMEELSEVNDPPPVTRHRASGASEGIFTHGRSTDNIAELGAPQPIPRTGTRRRSIVEEVRDLAQQSRQRSRLDDSATLRPEFSTPPKTYEHQDEDNLCFDAAPPPSISPTSRSRSRLDNATASPIGSRLSTLEELRSEDPTFNSNATILYTISYLIFFSILGTLARLGLKWLTFYPGTPVNIPVLWANFAGCLIIGFLLEDRNLFTAGWGTSSKNKRPVSTLEQAYQDHLNVKKTIPLYIGLATGFCGSLTSFSSFMVDAFLALSNNLPSPQSHPYPSGFQIPKSTSTIHRNAGYAVCAVLAVFILTTAISMSAVKFGAHIALFLDPYMPSIPFHLMRKYIDRAFVPIAWLAWLATLLLAILPPDRPGGPAGKASWADESWRAVVLSCVLAPVGCLLRFYLALKLNGVTAGFPLGTFSANVFGTAVLGMAYDLNRVAMGQGSGAGVGGGRVGCQVLQAVMDGFCGCLTTVSTWAVEMSALGKRGYVYGCVTVMSAFSLLLVIMGSVRWSVGFSDQVC